MNSLSVFCGSNPGRHAGYLDVARRTGASLARRGLTLIYGGGRVGLMGALADAVLEGGGRVIGVIPRMLLDREVGHMGLSELRVVTTLSERKVVMNDLADAFLTLPGGIGTMDELFEAWTWTQLHLHHKPCGLLNHDGYYDALLAFLAHSDAQGFLGPQARDALIVEREIERLLERLEEEATRKRIADGG
jgi:uncharacterized protein (TIGR00730 family)